MRRPLLSVAIFFSLGIALGWLVLFPFGYGFGISLLLFMAAVLFYSNKNVSAALLYCLFAFAGLMSARSSLVLPEEDITRVAKYYRKAAVGLKGVVVSDVREGNFFSGTKTSFTLKVREVLAPWGWREKSGKVLVNIYRDIDVSCGDELLLEGKLHRPYNFGGHEHFSYSQYLRYRGIHFILSVKKSSRAEILARGKGCYFRKQLYDLRDRLGTVLSSHLTSNESGIMRAILLGDRAGIPEHIRELFVKTGTAHILAISGLHVGIVAGLFLVFLRVLPVYRRYQLAAAIILLAGYALMTGARPSVVRAAIMAAVFLAGFIFEKDADTVNTLGLAALIILCWDPLNLFDIGFQLSFAAVAAILLVSPKLQGVLSKSLNGAGTRAAQACMNMLSVSCAAWLGVAGLIAYYFDMITPVTIIANMVIIPCLTLIVILGFGLLAAGIFLPAGAVFFSLCLKVALNAMVGTIFLFAQMPWAYFYVENITAWSTIGYYLFIFALFCLPWNAMFARLKNIAFRNQP